MRRVRRVLVLVLAGMLSRELEAQSAQAISLQSSGLYNAIFGDVFTDLNDGLGAEVQLRYTPSAFSVGAGFQYTTHEVEAWQPELEALVEGLPEDVQLYGGFVEPRYRIYAGSDVVAPYVSARFSLLKVGFPGDEFSLSSSYIQMNGGGGLLVRLGPRVNLDVGATFGYNRQSAGTLSVASTDDEFRARSSSGSNIVARLGLAIGLGG
jgi:hypothetical protein